MHLGSTTTPVNQAAIPPLIWHLLRHHHLHPTPASTTADIAGLADND